LGACGYSKIEDVSGAIHDLVVALQRGEAGADGGFSGGMQNMGEAVAPWERVALLDVSLNKGDLRVRGKLRIGRQELRGITAK